MWTDRRWLVPGLVASLLLNVFLIGLVVGHLVADPRSTADKFKGGLVAWGQVRKLPAEEKHRFGTTMTASKATIAAARKAQLDARRTLETDLTAPAYDKARVAADFAALRQAGFELQRVSNAALVDALAALSVQSRVGLINRLPPDQGRAP